MSLSYNPIRYNIRAITQISGKITTTLSGTIIARTASLGTGRVRQALIGFLGEDLPT